ncbi:PBSX family phage terminase large subunit [Amphibacillus sp. MSJ-3]|uniref:PBSX family phage terminase large subunit n=1 Tax=Amphibacillus sp. MSJ-3 TaxID=2841505 RepID=UPI001C0EAEB4|nr:PBSX family phage terminase large subunit [Amphibacillus sp. MSJ-3]MBU5594905.1 PBSX family phage terminase large subunit [Amphibacillus sp. MSJ-3]
MTIKLNFNKPSKVFNKKIFKLLNDYDTFTEVHYGGASSGKSHGVVQKVVLKALKPWSKPRRILFLRKVAATVKDSIFEDVLACLSSFGILDQCKINMSDYRIILPNKAVFIFKGMDNPEKIKSIKGLSDIVMEEATEFTLDDYTQLTLRLRDKGHDKKQIYLMFNPVSKVNWVFKYFFINKHKNTKVIQSTYKDNRFLDASTKENIEDLANRNPAYYKIYALGEFATLDKLVFPKFEKRIINAEEIKHLPSYFGLDFGYVNDPSAFIHLKVDEKNKRIYFVEEYVRKGLLNDQLAKAIIDLGYKKEVITADSAEKKSIEEIRRLGVDRIRAAKKAPDSIIQGIQFLSQFDFIVDERCVKLIEELENYTWKKDKNTNEYTNTPVDSYNHVIDASRYAVEGLHTKTVVNLFKGGL